MRARSDPVALHASARGEIWSRAQVRERHRCQDADDERVHPDRRTDQDLEVVLGVRDVETPPQQQEVEAHQSEDQADVASPQQ